jgi:Fic family protein
LYELKEEVRRSGVSLDDFDQKLDVSWIYHDNGLEGVALTYQEITHALNGKNEPAESVPIPLYQEIRNNKAAIDFVRDSSRTRPLDISLDTIKQVHAILFRDIPEASGGRYRQNVPLHRVYFHEILPPKRISYALNRVIQWLNSDEAKGLHPIRMATSLHHHFMHVFPFQHQSGKVGRLLMNLLLLHHGYPPAIIHAIERQQYYESLRDSVESLRQLILEAIGANLDSLAKHVLENAAKRRANVAT